jgi:hypothetical protein
LGRKIPAELAGQNGRRGIEFNQLRILELGHIWKRKEILTGKKNFSHTLDKNVINLNKIMQKTGKMMIKSCKTRTISIYNEVIK